MNGANAVRIIIEAIDRVTQPVQRITGRLRASLDGLGLPRIQEALRGVVAGAGRVVGEAARVGRAMLAGGAIAGGALGALALAAANAGDAAVKAAQSVGISAEDWQRYAYAADLAGVGSDQARMALQELGKQVTDAVNGNEQLAETFRSMGVELRDSEGRLRAVDDILADVADAFAGAPDGPRKTRVAMQLLGGEGARLIPLLNGGSKALREAGEEAERLGLVISNDTAAQMEGLNDNVSRLRGFLLGLRNSIAEQLIPVVAPLVERLVAWTQANREVIATKIVDWIKTIPPVVDALAARLTDLYDALQPVSGAFVAAVDWIGPLNAALGALGVLIVGKTIVALASLVTALGTLGAALLATPIGWFLGAVALLAGAAYLIWRNWEPISAFFAGLWQQVQAAGAAFVAWIEGAFLGAWTAAAGAVMAVWQPIEAWAARLWAAVERVFGGFAAFVNGVFAGDLTAAFDGLIRAGQGVRDYFVAFWRPAVDAFSAFVSWVDGAFSGQLSAAVEAAWRAIRPIVETIAAAFDRVTAIAGRVADIGRTVAGGVTGAASSLVGGARNLAHWVTGEPGSAAAAAASPPAAAPVQAPPLASPFAAGAPVQRVEAGGELTIRIDQEGRARVADMRPASPDQDWRIERGLSLAGVP